MTDQYRRHDAAKACVFLNIHAVNLNLFYYFNMYLWLILHENMYYIIEMRNILLISIFVSCKFRKLAPYVWLLSNYWLILQKFSEFNWNHVKFTVFAFPTSLENFKLIDYIILFSSYIAELIYIICIAYSINLLVFKNFRRHKIYNAYKKLFNRIIFFNSY